MSDGLPSEAEAPQSAAGDGALAFRAALGDALLGRAAGLAGAAARIGTLPVLPDDDPAAEHLQALSKAARSLAEGASVARPPAPGWVECQPSDLGAVLADIAGALGHPAEVALGQRLSALPGLGLKPAEFVADLTDRLWRLPPDAGPLRIGCDLGDAEGGSLDLTLSDATSKTIGHVRAEARVAAGKAADAPFRLLVLEAKPSARLMLEDMAAASGLDVTFEPSCEAVEALLGTDDSFTAVILDPTTRGQDWEGLIARVRERAQARGVAAPAFFSTAFASSTADINGYRKRGFDGHVEKPPTPEILRQLRQQCRQRG